MKTIYLIVAATLALAACSTMDARTGQRKCDDDRFALVAVEDDRSITVSPEPIFVCRRNAKITWSFAADVPAGYKFVDQTPNGKKSIDFTDPSQFDNCRAEANGARYSCNDKNTVSGAYKYVIYLQKPDGTILKSLDPHVVND